jgi:hypothetical protein
VASFIERNAEILISGACDCLLMRMANQILCARGGEMLLTRNYSEAERRLGKLARQISMKRDVLYHGTRYAQSILSMGVLFQVERNEQVCFTRSPEEAARWALLE